MHRRCRAVQAGITVAPIPPLLYSPALTTFLARAFNYSHTPSLAFTIPLALPHKHSSSLSFLPETHSLFFHTFACLLSLFPTHAFSRTFHSWVLAQPPPSPPHPAFPVCLLQCRQHWCRRPEKQPIGHMALPPASTQLFVTTVTESSFIKQRAGCQCTRVRLRKKSCITDQGYANKGHVVRCLMCVWISKWGWQNWKVLK